MKDITIFAKTNFRNKNRIFGIKTEDRRQHMYIIGKTGTGKTTMIFNMAIQDIINGHGICIVDPHGEFVETIIKRIPKERIKDVIYFNPIDTENPIGFNILEVPDPKYKHLVASDLMAIFTKIWANVWSARMEYILSNCVLALLDTPGTTLLGIPRILTDKDYRQKIINNIKNPVVRSFWVNEYEIWRDQFRNEAIVPIQNKVGQFLSTSLIRNIIGQSKSTINIAELMNNEKILLVNLSKGRIGEDNAALLGAMIITKIQLGAMERVRIHPSERKDFYLYVDEFQNFVTESFANILSESRKYKLNLIIAHQYIGQLTTKDSTVVRDAIFGNVGTIVIFRVGATDADFLEKELAPEFTIEDIVNLPNHQIYLKLMVDGVTSRPFSANTIAPLALSANEANHDAVIENSRKFFTKPRRKVEEEISKWSGLALESSTERARKFNDEKRATAGEREKTYWQKFSRGKDRRKPAFNMHLGEIGIEFEPPWKRAPMEKLRKTDKKIPKLPTQKTISLNELKKSEFVKDFVKKEFKRPEPVQNQKTFAQKPAEKSQKSKIQELQDAIKKAIEEA